MLLPFNPAPSGMEKIYILLYALIDKTIRSLPRDF